MFRRHISKQVLKLRRSLCSVRFVPDQRPEDLVAKLTAYVESEFEKLESGNTLNVRVKSVGDWWEADPESKLFRLAEKALQKASPICHSLAMLELHSCSHFHEHGCIP